MRNKVNPSKSQVKQLTDQFNQYQKLVDKKAYLGYGRKKGLYKYRIKGIRRWRK